MASLALTSKVFFNQLVVDQQQEIAQLHQEIEFLKLQRFFKSDGSHRAFQRAKQCSNYNVTKCACRHCFDDGRFDRDDVQVFGQVAVNRDTWTCSWQPWFNTLLHDRGFVVNFGHGPLQRQAPAFDPSHLSQEYRNGDSHFILIGRMNWQFWSFGARLHGACKRDDAEIVKYEALLKYIEDM